MVIANCRAKAGLFLALTAGGCTLIPDIPDDHNLPIIEILHHTTCELRDAFKELSQPGFEEFDAGKWLVGVSLAPKADREIIPGVGLTQKATIDPLRLRFLSWAVPSAELDVKGNRIIFGVDRRITLRPVRDW